MGSFIYRVLKVLSNSGVSTRTGNGYDTIAIVCYCYFLQKECLMRRFFVILTALSMLTNLSHARSPGTSGSLLDVPLSFWVYIEQSQSDWEIGGMKADTEVGRVGAAYSQHFSEHLQAGLFGGVVRVTQNNYARTAGITQSGGHLGMIVDAFPLRSEKFDIATGVTLAYYLVDGDEGSRKVESSWLEGLVYAKGIVKFNSIRISLGANYQYIDGTEKYNSTTLNQNADIKSEDELSGMAGIDFLVDSGTVGLHGEWGARNNISLKFSQDF